MNQNKTTSLFQIDKKVEWPKMIHEKRAVIAWCAVMAYAVDGPTKSWEEWEKVGEGSSVKLSQYEKLNNERIGAMTK